jgi:hypothetical protein
LDDGIYGGNGGKLCTEKVYKVLGHLLMSITTMVNNFMKARERKPILREGWKNTRGETYGECGCRF